MSRYTCFPNFSSAAQSAAFAAAFSPMSFLSVEASICFLMCSLLRKIAATNGLYLLSRDDEFFWFEKPMRLCILSLRSKK